jgi:hypothetical protein
MSLPFHLDLDHSANDDWHRDPHKPSHHQPAQAPNGPALVHRDVVNKKKDDHQAGNDNGGEESKLSLSMVKHFFRDASGTILRRQILQNPYTPY